MPPPKIGNSSPPVTSTPRVQLKAKRGLAKGLAAVSNGGISEARSYVSLSAHRPVPASVAEKEMTLPREQSAAASRKRHYSSLAVTSEAKAWLPEERYCVSLSANRSVLASTVGKEIAAFPLWTERADRAVFNVGGRIMTFELKNTKTVEPVSTSELASASVIEKSVEETNVATEVMAVEIAPPTTALAPDSWVGDDADMLIKENFTVHGRSALALILEDVEGERSAEESDVEIRRQAPARSKITEVVTPEPISALVSEKPVEETKVAKEEMPESADGHEGTPDKKYDSGISVGNSDVIPQKTRVHLSGNIAEDRVGIRRDLLVNDDQEILRERLDIDADAVIEHCRAEGFDADKKIGSEHPAEDSISGMENRQLWEDRPILDFNSEPAPSWVAAAEKRNTEESSAAMHRQPRMTAATVTNGPVELTVSLRSDTRHYGKAPPGRVLEYSENNAKEKIQKIKNQIAENKRKTAAQTNSMPEAPRQKVKVAKGAFNYISVWERMTVNRIRRGVDSLSPGGVGVLTRVWESRALKK